MKCGLKARQNVSLSIAPGKTLGLLGPNGAGKTTLLNVLSGYVPATSCSELSIGSADLLKETPSRRLAMGFGRSFQHAELFAELSVLEIFTLAASLAHRHGPAAERPEQVAERIVSTLNLEPYARSLPPELPFGVQKVVDIGRLMAAGPSVVALDEPFSGLDADEMAEVRAILRGMRQAGVSILLIDHAVNEVLDIADEVVVLDFGSVLSRGTPADIRADPLVLEAYFGSSGSQEINEAVDG